MKYHFIIQYRQEYPISTMCRVLEVAVSGFYAWLRRAPSRRSQENMGLGECIVRLYQENRQVYGSPRYARDQPALREKAGGATHAGTRAECETTQASHAHHRQPA